MKETRVIMGMPITLIIAGCPACRADRLPAAGGAQAVEPSAAAGSAGACAHTREAARRVFSFLEQVDDRFSPYKETSEVSRIRRAEAAAEDGSDDMREVVRLCRETAIATGGYFDAWASGSFDPSGVVKGWSLHRAGGLLHEMGFSDFSIDGGGDVEARGGTEDGGPWRVGVRNPFDPRTLVKILAVSDRGVATSGNYIRGRHIVNPITRETADEVASVTVIGPNVLDAARFATASFAMGRGGAAFLASLDGFEGYVVEKSGRARFSPGFKRYVTS